MHFFKKVLAFLFMRVYIIRINKKQDKMIYHKKQNEEEMHYEKEKRGNAFDSGSGT